MNENYSDQFEELSKSINNCIDLLEEAIDTCNDRKILSLIEEAHTALDQLANILTKYE
jgi:hypothetical protein